MKSAGQEISRDAAPLSEQAAHWWITLSGDGCTNADREAFADWVMRSPERVAAYLRVTTLAAALNSDDVSWPATSAAVLIQQARSAPPDVIPLASPLHDGRKSVARSWTGSTRMALYGSLAAMLIAGIALWSLTRPQQYYTGRGEQRSVLLDDGSLVTLNTSSAIEVRFRDDRRIIHLTRGEALFQVAHDAARPFDVSAGHATIRAVGTQFNVDRRRNRTTVTVVEGKVRVSSDAMQSDQGPGAGSAKPEASELVVAAERIVITDAGMSEPEHLRNLVPVTAWTQRQLVFEGRPLREVAEEFNRYNRHHIRIESPGLQEQQVTGVFQANDSASFLAFLAGIRGVKIETDAQGHHVVTMNPAAAAPGQGPN